MSAVDTRASEVEVLPVRMPVLSAPDVVGSKLKALTEQQCDCSSVLPVPRAFARVGRLGSPAG